MAGIKGQAQAKPSEVSPQLQQQAQSEFAAALNMAPKGTPPAPSGTPPPQSEFADALNSQSDQSGQDQAPSESPGLLSQGLDAAGRALNLAGGVTRAGLAEVAGMGAQALQGKNPLDEQQVVTPEDIKNALKGKGPGWAEYLRRMGVSEGGSISALGQKVTLRGAEGLALDIATDPLTQIAKLAKESPYLAKLFNSPGKASEAVGEALYKSALPAKAQGAAQAMIEGVPEAGIAGAPVGGAEQLAKKAGEMSQAIGKVRQGLYDRATQLGVSIDAAHPLERAESVISGMTKDPSLRPLADTFTEMLDAYKAEGKVPIDLVSEWKTNLYDSLPANAWNGPKLRNVSKMFKSALAADFREAIVGAGNAAEKGLGDSIEALNNKWGTLLSATQPLQKAAQATGGGSLGRMIDGAVLATGGIKAEAVKKGYELMTSPYAKTLAGKALMAAGRSGLATGVTNQAIIGASGAMPPQGQDQPPPEEGQ